MLKLGDCDGIKCDVEQDKGPFEEGVDGVGWMLLAAGISTSWHCVTSGDVVHFVLDEEVDQGHQSPKEGACKEFPIFEGSRVAGTQGYASKRPRKGSDKVGNHEDVVPVVVVGRSYICPSTTCHGTEQANASNEFWERRVRLAGEDVPQSYEGESGTYFLLSWVPASPLSRDVPDVRAMNSIKTDRSGYLSPMVADTEGNHSWG